VGAQSSESLWAAWNDDMNKNRCDKISVRVFKNRLTETIGYHSFEHCEGAVPALAGLTDHSTNIEDTVLLRNTDLPMALGS